MLTLVNCLVHQVGCGAFRPPFITSCLAYTKCALHTEPATGCITTQLFSFDVDQGADLIGEGLIVTRNLP